MRGNPETTVVSLLTCADCLGRLSQAHSKILDIRIRSSSRVHGFQWEILYTKEKLDSVTIFPPKRCCKIRLNPGPNSPAPLCNRLLQHKHLKGATIIGTPRRLSWEGRREILDRGKRSVHHFFVKSAQFFESQASTATLH